MQKAAENAAQAVANAAQAARKDARGAVAADHVCPCFVLYLF
jgi:hypothetical protein